VDEAGRLSIVLMDWGLVDRPGPTDRSYHLRTIIPLFVLNHPASTIEWRLFLPMPISPFAHRPIAHRPIARKPSKAGKGGGLLTLFLIGGLVVWVGWLLAQNNVQNQLQFRLQQRLGEMLAGTQLVANISHAEFLEGKGIRINDSTLMLLDSQQSNKPVVMIEVYEAFVQLPVALAELIVSTPSPEAIQVRRAKIRLLQNEVGDWHVRQLIDQLSLVEGESDRRIPLIFRDCTIELISTESDSITFSEVGLIVTPMEHDGESLVHVTGEFNSREVSGTRFELWINETRKLWQTSIDVPTFRLNPNVLALVPTRYRDELSQWPRIMGSLSGRATARGDLEFATEPEFECQGSLLDFYCEDPNLPLPIRQGRFQFQANNRELRISSAEGELGNGKFRFDFSQTAGATPAEPLEWNLKGSIDDFDFSSLPRFVSWLPPFFDSFQQDYHPQGTADIHFHLSQQNNELTKQVTGKVKNMSFTWAKFPYTIENCYGIVSLVQDQVKIQIESQNGKQSITGEGVINNPGPDATFLLTMQVPDSLPIDEKLLDAVHALPDDIAEIINDFRPTGRIGLTGRIEKQSSSGAVHQHYDFQLKHCNVRHKSFDYPIENINGLIQMRDRHFYFVNLFGNNGGCNVTANGEWNPEQGLNLQFQARAVPLDQRLRDALRVDLRRIWQGFRPRGVASSIAVQMTKPIDMPLDVVVAANITKPAPGSEVAAVSIKPTWFPYEIRQLSGDFLVGKNQIQLRDISGQHGRTWLACQGAGEYNHQAWQLNLTDLLIGSLKIDDDLLDAVPQGLAPSLRKLAFEGFLNVQGEVMLSGKHGGPLDPTISAGMSTGISDHSPSQGRDFASSAPLMPQTMPVGTDGGPMSFELGWNLKFDMNQASLRIGLPVRNVFGAISLKGRYDGNQLACLGELDVDSLTIFDSQITEIKGPIWLDGKQSAAGVFAMARATPIMGNEATSPQQPLPAERSLTAKLNQGILKLDAQLNSDPTGEFYLQTTLADACLDQFCKDNAPGLKEISGRSFAAVRMQGNSLGTHSLRGSGSIHLRQAQLYELPVVLSLLKSLRLGSRTKTAFDSGNIDFQIVGTDIELTRIEMLGEPISLLGNGKVDLQRNIDLNFYSVMGKNRLQIPVITELYRASSQQILWIHIDGTLDSPQTHRNVLPQINDSIKQLFQPVELPATARGGTPWSPPSGKLHQPVLR